MPAFQMAPSPERKPTPLSFGGTQTAPSAQAEPSIEFQTPEALSLQSVGIRSPRISVKASGRVM
jgi:hypothetical protein